MWFGGAEPPALGGGGVSTTSANSQQQQQSQQNTEQQTKQEQQQQPQDPNKISFHLKTSIFTRRVTLERERLALGVIKQLACGFLNELYFQPQYPPGTPIGDHIRRSYPSKTEREQLYERLLLRKYCPQSDSFQPFSSAADIEPDCCVGIEISERSVSTSNLLNSTHLPSSTTTTTATTTDSATGVIGGQRPDSNELRMAHDFRPESFLVFTYCAACSALIKGLYRQGFRCHQCKRNYCLACRQRADQTGDTCLPPASAVQHPQQANESSNKSFSGSMESQDGARESQTTPATPKEREMSKRKSATNLLHFNIANPFKSSHAPPVQQQQPASGQQSPGSEASGKAAKNRGSAGALEPVLQQLSKSRGDQKQNQNQPQKTNNNNNLLTTQLANISLSHQDLSKADQQHQQQLVVLDDAKITGGQQQHLSNSARTSAHDLQATQPTSSANHTFISMDWIQLAPESQCGVCNKPLARQRSSGSPSPLASETRSSSNQAPPALCRCCKLQVHAHCQSLVLPDCLARLAEASRSAAAAEERGENKLQGSSSNASRDNIRLHRLAPSVKHLKRPDATKPVIEGWLKHTTLADEQARRHYWRLDETDITLYESDSSPRYFKAIALNKISRVMSAHALPKRVREDVLGARQERQRQQQQQQQEPSQSSSSAATSPKRSPELEAQMRAMFAFELASGSMFLVQATSEEEASRWRESLAGLLEARKSPVGSDIATSEDAKPAASSDNNKAAEEAKTEPQEAPKPPQATNNNNTGSQYSGKVAQEKPLGPSQQRQVAASAAARHHQATQQQQRLGGHRGQLPTYTDPNRSRLYNRPRKVIKLNPMAVPDHLIEGKYLVECDRNKGRGFEELGSGQFGKVYAAISEWKAVDAAKGLWSGVPVAIKEISKARFDLLQQAKLKNEADILSRIDHPGVIILERVHDLPDKIYIVMEQLEDDMLEMIVSTEEKRLSERVTKFLTYQILAALKHLHNKNIAHCDLKPENVLLVERRSQFPQIKLCDFGFAKIIEDNSFRSSLVGTPAYLAPEVVKGERYNRSVDLWSVGVIVYVSLSGEFPFNEGENIHDQISRANFMYPDQPWSKISAQAKSFINSLLRVNCEKRLSANKALMDDWIQDYQLWCDLSELEFRVGKRWVTDDADYERWTRYAREHNLQVPRNATQLHEELLAE